MAVPVLAVAIARDPRLSLDIFVSRRMVFHTSALLGTGPTRPSGTEEAPHGRPTRLVIPTTIYGAAP